MNDAEILYLRRVTWRRWMQKFCTTLFFALFITVPTTNGWCRNSASQFGGLKTVDAEILHDLFLRLILQQMNDAEILHLKSVAWKLWMQKFCKTLFPFNSLPYLQQMNDAEILHLKSAAWKMWMQKFCMTLFPLNLLPYLQQMNDAEILHLKSVSVAWKLWMQKFCMTFIPLNSLRFLQQMNNTEILHLKSVASKIWMQKICTTFFPLTAVI